MNNKNKIAAFTLMDVLTGMVITSVIIAMVFYLFSSLNEQVYHYGNTRSDLNHFIVMKQDLKYQFDLAEDVIAVPDGVVLSGGNGEIEYFKEGNLLIRETKGLTDTLLFTITEFKTTLLSDNKSVETATVKTEIGEQELSVTFYKDRGLAGVINQTLLHEF